MKNEKSNKPVHLRQPKPCTICKKMSVQKYHPFCSSHCANVDLSRWLKGHYAVPMVEEDGNEAVEADQE